MSHIISEAIQKSIKDSSWIRKMFEQGAALKAEHGVQNVFDFSLGNPNLEPPEKFAQAISAIVNSGTPGQHRYTPNAGVPEVRAYIAQEMAAETGLAYKLNHVVVTCGAAGGLNIILKTMLNPGDEVITFTPYFVEYNFYASNHGGKLVLAATDEAFQPDIEALEKAITPRTRAVLLNAPNNPTGVIYPEAVLKKIAQVLTQASEKQGRPIFILADEPYRKLVFDNAHVPWIPPLYPHTIVVTSHSKDLGLAAERLGYVAVHPEAADGEKLMEGLILANRILGFVNAPALVQRALPMLKGEKVNVGYYQMIRDKLMPPLLEMGYEMVKPQGAFYLFPKSPIPDDVAFTQAALKHNLLVVPGTGFGAPGHFRIALCVEPEVVERSLPAFEKLIKEV